MKKSNQSILLVIILFTGFVITGCSTSTDKTLDDTSTDKTLDDNLNAIFNASE